MDEQPNNLELAKLLAPYLCVTAVVTILCVVLLWVFTPLGRGGSAGAPAVVTFDVVKFSNAQRAVASAFIKRDADVSEANDLLLGLSDRTRASIEKIAGRRLVMVKQAVAQGGGEDITDAVLKDLNLPTVVPTSDGAAYTLDVAPTMLAAPLRRQEGSHEPLSKDKNGVLP